MDLHWGIDLGGTKIEGVVLEGGDNPTPLKRLRVPTEADRGYQHILDQIAKLVEVLIAETGVKPDKIGIGTPGVIDPILQTMKNSNTTIMNGMPFQKDLEQLLKLPIVVANDANCFAVAEANMGIVKDKMPDAKVVFGVIMGSGVGGGIVIDGKPLTGRQGIAGEWGHNFLDASGGDCYCGKVGCVETVLSGKSLERFYESQSGEHLKLKTIVERYHAGTDGSATKTVKRMLKFFGKGIANVINILDPDAIVLGGGVGNVDLLYKEGVEEARKYVFNNRFDTVFLKPKLGDSAGVFGAALL
ncbi:MAG: ROK family protein [Saprospiraceae bacterium]